MVEHLSMAMVIDKAVLLDAPAASWACVYTAVDSAGC
jgi:hypothetical protein